MRKRLIAVIVGALAVGLIAGCGSGGGSDSGSDNGGGGSGSEITTNSLSKAEYVKQVNAICTKYHDKTTAEGEAYVKKSGLPNAIDQPTFFATFATLIGFPLAQEEAEKISALGAPKGLEDEVTEMMTAMEKGIEEGKKKAKEVKKSDKTLDRPAGLQKANDIAKKMGLNEDCMVT